MIASEEAARLFCAQRTDKKGLDRLGTLASALIEENARQNLASTASLEHVWQRHFADSLQLLDYAPGVAGTWLDLGSGAGFPGLALAIALPDTDMVLVESRKRRVDWLNRCVELLELKNCRVIGARLESVSTFGAAAITARAFAPLAKLLSLSARFSTPDTVWLLPKGRSAAQELSDQPAAAGGMFHVEQSVTDGAAGILIGRGVPPPS